MRDVRLLWMTPLFLGLLAGCGSDVGPRPEENTVPPPASERTTIALADLLDKPREELATMTDEWLGRAETQQRMAREGRLVPALEADLRLPLVIPVFREAKYSPRAGFSLPPYAAEGEKDDGLALHLARYGDTEAARKLATADVLARIEECRCARNYPVEWTRLVSVMQHVTAIDLAAGEGSAVDELIDLHKQLRVLLDDKAAKGPLGSALLAGGQAMLRRAAETWRSGSRAAVAHRIEEALSSWGAVPTPTLAVTPGTAREQVARLLCGSWQGRVLSAPPARAFDLLDLPLPDKGTQAVLACCDGDGRLSELLVTYRPGAVHLYPEPRHLARVLDEHGLASTDGKSPGVSSRIYTFGGITCEAAVVARGTAVGALVRLADSKGVPAPGQLPRDFGAAHLDRGFEQNRLRLAPEKRGAVVQTDRADVLARVRGPIRGPRLVQAAVERQGDDDVTARVRLRYGGEGPLPPLHEAALALWAVGGPARFGGVEEEEGGHLAFVWEDGQTRCTLRLPYAGGEVLELEAEDQRGGDRAAAARGFDRAERKARLAAGKPLTRLPRYLDYPGLELGKTRTQLTQTLPPGPNYVRQNLADTLAVIVTGEPAVAGPYTPRHIFVRFDGAGRAVELRTRYGETKAGGAWAQAVLAGLTRQCGAPAESPGPWADVWADLPARKPPATLYRWQDDLTVLTCQRDAGGVEVILRDASDEAGDGPSLPPLQYLPHGPGEVSLGDSREEVNKLAGGKPHTLPDGAVMLTPRSPLLYDAYFVWLEGDRVTRIVARHAKAGPDGAKPAQMAQLLNEAWGQEVRALGWPMRRDYRDDKTLQALGWHDDVTRVRLFWQESQHGPPQLFTEWRALPGRFAPAGSASGR